MLKYRIYDRLKEYAQCDKCFHMPGHKCAAEFAKLFPVAPIDITELEYSDNLSCPQNVIYSAQQELAGITGAAASFILTDGSTSGVLSMLYAVKPYGNKVIIPVNCHQSVYNACKLFGLEPVIARGEFVNGVLKPPRPEQIYKLLSAHSGVCAMVAISPDYYGNIAPLAEYSRILKAQGKFLLVDGAHGAHLFTERQSGIYAGVYADIWVDGAHKTLPTLTQGALLNVNDRGLLPHVCEALGIFRTSSPGYPVMASVEYGYKYLFNNAELVTAAKARIERFKKSIPFAVYPSGDYAKVAVDFGGAGINSDLAEKELQKRGIYCEMSDGRYLLFYLSPTADGKSLQNAAEIICGLKLAKYAGTYVPKPEKCAADGSGYLEAVNSEYELVSLDKAAGRVCARNAGITPPCIPAVIAGEIITEETVGVLKSAKNAFGLYDGLIAVKKCV